MIRKWDLTDEKILKQCLVEVIARIDEQEGSEFGIIAAQDVVDIVAKHLGPQAYNSALEDAKKTIEAKLADIEVDLDVLRVMQ
jgi:uncharacterized protein (DUF2164 family)